MITKTLKACLGVRCHSMDQIDYEKLDTEVGLNIRSSRKLNNGHECFSHPTSTGSKASLVGAKSFRRQGVTRSENPRSSAGGKMQKNRHDEHYWKDGFASICPMSQV